MDLEALQSAIYARLSDQVGASVIGIYSDTPQASEGEDASAFPYITLGPYVANTFDTKAALGGSYLAQIHIWTRTHDNLARAALHDAVAGALHRHTLTIAGADYTDCTFQGSEDFPDIDGETRHIVMRFRVVSH